jgi:hypothetical protein
VGAKLAKGKILLFVGDDCMPAPDLIARHWLSHKQHGKNVTQGYTPWHPKAQTPFMGFLNKTGLQANWNALRNEDGGWMRDVSAGFCLTTNYSIKKKRFWQIGGFDESFSGAAWEDIELGYRLNKFGESATFAPEAVNYHYHKYELPDFLKRCFMEGTHRLSICFPHPEMGPSLLEPKQLRAVADIDVGDIQSQAMTVNSPNMDEVWGLWSATCQAFSFKGVQHSIDAGFPGLQALYYAEENTEVIEIVAGTASVKNGRWAYALHCAEWMLTRRPDHWYTYAFAAETKKAIGDIDGALFLTRSAIIKNPAAAWHIFLPMVSTSITAVVSV